jgi:hypothetical protein
MLAGILFKGMLLKREELRYIRDIRAGISSSQTRYVAGHSQLSL